MQKNHKCTYDVTDNFNLHKSYNKSGIFVFLTTLKCFTIKLLFQTKKLLGRLKSIKLGKYPMCPAGNTDSEIWLRKSIIMYVQRGILYLF